MQARIASSTPTCLAGTGLQTAWRDGLPWLEANRRMQALQSPSLRRNSRSRSCHGGSRRQEAPLGLEFFTLLKGATVDAYYSTQEGLKTELGWNANTFLSEFKGCTHKEHQSLSTMQVKAKQHRP